MYYKLPLSKIEKQSENLLVKGFSEIENLLPDEEVNKILSSLPKKECFKLHKNQFESKRVFQNAKNFNNNLSNLYEDFLHEKSEFAKRIQKIAKLPDLKTDYSNYAGGVSLMSKNDYLDLHIDNSHNAAKTHYRRVNLLYYLSKKEWYEGNGGELILKPFGEKNKTYKIPPRNNTLVIMLTNKNSQHGVKKINNPDFERYCISTYYYSSLSQSGDSYYHVTTFRYPDNKFKDIKSQINSKLRNLYKYFK